MYFPDLSTSGLFCEGPDVRSIGWLEGSAPYARGAVSPTFIKILGIHVKNTWVQIMTMGVHVCSLEGCPRDHASCSIPGAEILFIPTDKVLYVSPAMVSHYVETHEYKPPDEFIEAVKSCPFQGSSEFLDLMRRYKHHTNPFLDPDYFRPTVG